MPTDDHPEFKEFPLDTTLTVGFLREALVGVADNVELSFDTFHLDAEGHTTFVPGPCPVPSRGLSMTPPPPAVAEP